MLLREALALPPEGAGEGAELERRALPDEAEDEAEEVIVGSEGKPFDPPPFPPLPVDGRSVGSKAGSAVPSAKATAGARKSNAKERFMVVLMVGSFCFVAAFVVLPLHVSARLKLYARGEQMRFVRSRRDVHVQK